MSNERRPLTLEEMEQVTGGYVVKDPEQDKFWVVRQDGTVIGPAPDEKSAVSFAKAFNVSQDVITLDEYKEKFGRELEW